MTGVLREWLLGITCATMIVALAETLTPVGAGRKVVKLAGGLLMMFVVLQPFLQLDESVITDIFDTYSSELTAYDDTMVQVNENFIETIIVEQTGAYILDKANGLGIACQVSVETVADEAGNPIPYSITVEGEIAEEDRERLTAQITADLAIPAQRQYYQGGEG